MQSGKAHEFSRVSAVAGFTGHWGTGSDELRGIWQEGLPRGVGVSPKVLKNKQGVGTGILWE